MPPRTWSITRPPCRAASICGESCAGAEGFSYIPGDPGKKWSDSRWTLTITIVSMTVTPWWSVWRQVRWASPGFTEFTADKLIGWLAVGTQRDLQFQDM